MATCKIAHNLGGFEFKEPNFILFYIFCCPFFFFFFFMLLKKPISFLTQTQLPPTSQAVSTTTHLRTHAICNPPNHKPILTSPITGTFSTIANLDFLVVIGFRDLDFRVAIKIRFDSEEFDVL